MNADDCWLIYAYRSLSGSLRTALTIAILLLLRPPLLLLHHHHLLSLSLYLSLSLSFLSLFLPSHFSSFSGLQLHSSIIVQVTLLLFFSPSLSPNYFTTYSPLPFFFFFPFIPPLFSLQPTALPHKKPNSPGITKQTLNPINISNRQPLRGLLSAIDASLDNQFEFFLSRVSCKRNKECSLILG